MSSKSRHTPSKPQGTPPRSSRSFAPLLIAGPIVGLGLGLWLLGVVWPVDSDPDTAFVYGGMSGFFSGLLGAGAIAGSISMSRRVAWLSPIVGLLFAVGFTGLVLASMGSESAPWMLIGVTAIAACVIWFYVLGMVSGSIPPIFLNQYGTWAAPVAGVVLIVVGAVTGSLEALAIGVLTIAAWVGIVIGSAVMSRRPSEQATR